MSDTSIFVTRAKALLNELEAISNGDVERNEYNFSLPDQVVAVGKYLKACAEDSGDIDLLGLGLAMIHKGEQVLEADQLEYEEYQQSMEREYWESKTEFSVTEICQYLKLDASPHKLNQVLEEEGLQTKDGKKWQPTDKGLQYCVVKNEGKQNQYFRWTKKLVELFKAEQAKPS